MILDVIVEDKKIRLKEQKEKVSLEQMKRKAAESKRKVISFADALTQPGLSVIGEFKNSSPSHGIMHNEINLDERIMQYNVSVNAISCLTEEDHFNGSVAYFEQIREMTGLPMLRKDFIYDAYQVYEAKAIGADAILLIAAILDDQQFKKLYDLAYDLGMDVLCEVHDQAELERMLAMQVKIIGMNNRNLNTFEVSLATTKTLAKLVPTDRIIVSESGITTEEDITQLRDCHADAFLIGTALMEHKNPQQLIRHWKSIYGEEE